MIRPGRPSLLLGLLLPSLAAAGEGGLEALQARMLAAKDRVFVAPTIRHRESTMIDPVKLWELEPDPLYEDFLEDGKRMRRGLEPLGPRE